MKKLLDRIRHKILNIILRIGDDASGNELSGNIDTINGQAVRNSETAVSFGCRQSHISVAGWAMDGFHKAPADEVYVCIGGKEYRTTYGTSRPDVARHFNKSDLLNCGFCCNVPIEAFLESRNSISIKTISSKNRKTASGISPLTITADLPRNAAFYHDEYFGKDFDSKGSVVFPSTEKPLVSIVVSGSHSCNQTRNCLRSILRNTQTLEYEVICTGESSRQTETAENIACIAGPTDLAPAGSRNHGAETARGEYLVFLDNDTYVRPGWLASLMAIFSEHQNVGAAGSRLIFTSGRLAGAGGIVWKDQTIASYGRYQHPLEYQYNYVKDTDFCQPSAMMVKADVFRQLGGFDESFSSDDYRFADFCFRLREIGLRAVYQPESEVIKAEITETRLTEVQELSRADRERFFSRRAGVIESENRASTEGDYLARDRSNPERIILYVDHCIPRIDEDGASFITYQYLKAMKSLGYKIILWPQDSDVSDPYTMILQQMGIEVVYGAVSFEEYLKKNGAYLNISFIAQPAGSLPYLELLRKHTKSRILYMAMDLHFLREMRGREIVNDIDEEEMETTKSLELDLMRKSDISLFFSDVEVDYLRNDFPEIRALCIPWIQQVSNKTADAARRSGLLFIGAFGHLPNCDAVLWFHDEILPEICRKMPDIRTVVAGSNPPERVRRLACGTFEITGQKNEIDHYFDTARLFIAPIRFGAGFKTKIARAMSHGLPVVTTPMGAEGMGLTDGENVCIADTAAAFAEKVLELYSNENLWTKISSNSMKHVSESYSQLKAEVFLKKHILC
jgi:GT2 family glycosyltransferase